ncbi:hypothetical protein D1BOALGB6SA_3069 [Olavius sp. associated proteobacterium Delta 1]|nr:hypothetical protein D1BOALGB6SA_3069 [Olavius sp. associated proteobacterium Delta 1]
MSSKKFIIIFGTWVRLAVQGSGFRGSEVKRYMIFDCRLQILDFRLKIFDCGMHATGCADQLACSEP